MCLSTDLDKLDNEKKDLIQSDISALHRFYSKHLEFPDNESLVTLFAQVRMQPRVTPGVAFPCTSACSQHTVREGEQKQRGGLCEDKVLDLLDPVSHSHAR